MLNYFFPRALIDMIRIEHHTKPQGYQSFTLADPPSDVTSEAVIYAVYVVFTWLQIVFLSTTLRVMGCTVTSHRMIKHWCPHSHTTARGAKQWDGMRHNHLLCSTVASKKVSDHHPHYATNKDTPEVGSVIVQWQLLVSRWRNVTSSQWKCPFKGQCWFEWSFCLCLMTDWGLPLQIYICAFWSEVSAAPKRDGARHKSKETCEYLFWE